MSIVAIIPARGGSKGIKNKNFINFCGKPLLAWTIKHSLESKYIKDVYVSSDSNEILTVAMDNGAKAIQRPSTLATDNSTSESALIHALEIIEAKTNSDIDMVVFLQATSPLREKNDIDNALEKFQLDRADSLFSSARLEDFFIFEEKNNSFESINFDYRNRSRRQVLRPQYLENGSIYIFKPWVLRNENNRLGGKISTYIMDYWKSFEIDSTSDFQICEWYMKKKNLTEDYKLLSSDIDLIVYDFDGVMTDNRVFITQDGIEGVYVNRADGYGIEIIKKIGIPQLILSTEANPVVLKRAKKLNINVISNCMNKKEALLNYCKINNFIFSRVLYVGNDLNDFEVMKSVGITIAPKDAHQKIIELANYISSKNGGDGVIRELADKIILK